MISLILLLATFGLSSSDKPCQDDFDLPPGCSCLRSASNKSPSGNGWILNCLEAAISGQKITNIPNNRNLDSKVEGFYLDDNNITSLDLGLIATAFPNLVTIRLSRNKVKTLANSQATSHQVKELGLEELDLSFNNLQVIQVATFAGLANLQRLNLSNNQIHTFIQDRRIELISLTMLDMSYNLMTEVPELLTTASNLEIVDFSHNKISRITDETFSGRDVKICELVLSHNYIMAMDDDSITGLNLTMLDLGYNSLRRVPTAALAKTRIIGSLILDGNLFERLETGAISGINVVRLSISGCKSLTIIEMSSLVNLPMTKIMKISNNPALVYMHPGGITEVPELQNLDLTSNNLSSLEDMRQFISSESLQLDISNNNLQCHCSLSWTQEESAANFFIADLDDVKCDGMELKNLDFGNKTWCKPYILPLFGQKDVVEMGHNISWPCRTLPSLHGNDEAKVSWQLPGTRFRSHVTVSPGSCGHGQHRRACVDSTGVLSLSYVHPEERGQYTCHASNLVGNFTRSVQLEVKVLNIILFPVSVAASFVTLSWNTSQSLARDYILQVYTGVRRKHKCEDHPFLQYNNIEVNHKMNSYTISNLSPDTTYSVMLCLNKNSNKIPISMLRVTTRPESYMEGLGIVKDYTAIITVVLVLGFAGFSCIALTLFRLYRFRCLMLADSVDTKNIMSVSPSEHDSWSRDNNDDYPRMLSPKEYHSWTAEKISKKSESFVNSYKEADCDSREKSKLMENEVASPVDEVDESSA